MLPPPSREAASRDGGGGRWRPRRSLSAWAAALRGSARHEAAEAAADLGEGWARARLLTRRAGGPGQCVRPFFCLV